MSTGPRFGLLRMATIDRFDPNTGLASIVLNLGEADVFDHSIQIQMPAAWIGPNGEFSGGWPAEGSTIYVGLSEGMQWSFVSYALADDVYRKPKANLLNQSELTALADWTPGGYLTQILNASGTDFIHILSSPNDGVSIGDGTSRLQIDPNTGIITNTYAQNMAFTEAHRHIIGIVQRDRGSIDRDSSALDSHNYLRDSASAVGLDPQTKAGLSTLNPPLTEDHKVYYEYAYQSYDYTTDENEAARLAGEDIIRFKTFSRQNSRADAFSLNLTAPNYLAESIIGTAVDLYGNILDINRQPLPSGLADDLSYTENQENKEQTLTGLLTQQRRSIAYHFELNARKPVPPNVQDNSDYARNRSRLFVDVDKEGQFKINIPASSEAGNIPLLTRYENYCVLKAAEEGGNPNQFIRSNDKIDIISEAYGDGYVQIKSANQEYQPYIVPNDRFTEQPIKLGTAFHNIGSTILTHQAARQPEDQDIIQEYEEAFVNELPRLDKVVTNEITIGENAGGRSGTITLDGSLSVSIGANTVDRQSLWIDCAGGTIANFGRDLQGMSFAGTFDGDIFIQVGGTTVSNDSRFQGMNSSRDGTVDIRVVTNATMTVLRIDSTGVKVYTPGMIDLVSYQNLRLKAFGDMIFDAENIFMYGNDRGTGRYVRKVPGKTLD